MGTKGVFTAEGEELQNPTISWGDKPNAARAKTPREGRKQLEQELVQGRHRGARATKGSLDRKWRLVFLGEWELKQARKGSRRAQARWKRGEAGPGCSLMAQAQREGEDGP